MLIAVPAETDPGKGRVAATPETVKKFIGLGAKVVVQSGAGLAFGNGCRLWVAIGAITFTGSVIALDGRMSGKPIMLPQRHAINIGLAVACSSCSSCHPRRRPLHILAHRAGRTATRKAALRGAPDCS
jgi:hypothetical protein